MLGTANRSKYSGELKAPTLEVGARDEQLGALVHLAVARRRHPDAAAQVVAQVAARAEAGQPGDLVDGQIARLQQLAGAVDAAAAHPRTRATARSPRGTDG